MPFGRLIAPTLIESTAAEMSRIIRDANPGIDELNPRMWNTLGGGNSRVVEFLQRLIQLERERQQSYGPAAKAGFIAVLSTQYPEYGGSKGGPRLGNYLYALDRMLAAHTVPEEILRPWTYEPQTIAQDVAGAASKAVGKLGLWIVLGIFAYGLATTLLPQLSSSLFGRK
jgi:hypothetical protein